MATRAKDRFQVIGHPSIGFYGLVTVLLAVFGWGIYAYYREFTEGMAQTGLRDIGTMGGATWGLYVAFIIYFVGVSFAGITTAALVRMLNLRQLRPISRIAELLTIIALILAACSVLVDLGQPLRGIVNLFRYARPQSPFFGTFTLVISGYLFASLVYFYLDGRRDAALLARYPSRLRWFYRLWAAGYRHTPAERRRHEIASFWLAIAILPLLVTAHSTLGFVFGIQSGRPGWFSALQAPGFVVMAGISGLGLLAVIAAVIRVTSGAGKQVIPEDVFRYLGIFLAGLILTYLYFTVAELLTIMYAGPRHDVETTWALLAGEYAWMFWGSVGSLVFSLILLAGSIFVLRRHIIGSAVVSGLLVNLAAIGKRFLIVVPSQTVGPLLPYGAGHYAPTWVEYSIVLGLFALGTLMFALFSRIFPLIELAEEVE